MIDVFVASPGTRCPQCGRPLWRGIGYLLEDEQCVEEDGSECKYFKASRIQTDDPTVEGMKRFPTTEGYYTDGGERVAPCTCKPECPATCKGECGCEACKAAYFDAIEE